MADYNQSLQQSGGLGKYVSDIMERAGAALPEQMQQRDEAQQGYLDQMQKPYDTMGNDISMYAQMGEAFAKNPKDSSVGLSQALQAFGGNQQTKDLAQMKRADLASKENAALKSGNVKQTLEEMKTLPGMMRGAGGSKPVVKMDKDGNMVSYNPATDETKVVHSSQRGEYQRIWSKAYEKAVTEGMDSPEQYAHGIATDVLGKSAPGSTTPGVSSGTPPTLSGASAPAPASPEIQYKNKSEEARKKEYATGMEAGAVKDYNEVIRPQAEVADSMLNTVGTVRQIPRTQDMFAPWREKLGATFDALGMDGSMVKEAQSLQQVRPLLAKLANDRLMMTKGVQTEGDAQRAYNEFVRITDTQQAADFMYAWAEELANRVKFKKSVYDLAAEEKGTMQEGSKYWPKTDYAQTAPVAILNGKPWTYTKWREAFIKANPDAPANELMKEWNKLARGEK